MWRNERFPFPNRKSSEVQIFHVYFTHPGLSRGIIVHSQRIQTDIIFNHYWGLNIYLCVASLWCMRYEGDYFESWTIKRKWMLNRLIKRPTDNIDRVQGDGHISSQSSVYWDSGLTLGNYLYFQIFTQHASKLDCWLGCCNLNCNWGKVDFHTAASFLAPLCRLGRSSQSVDIIVLQKAPSEGS